MSTIKLPSNLEPYRSEIDTYLRELPRLIEEGEEGRHVLIKGDRTYGIWDTYADGVQHGLMTFDDDHFLVQVVSEMDRKRIEQYRHSADHATGAVA